MNPNAPTRRINRDIGRVGSGSLMHAALILEDDVERYQKKWSEPGTVVRLFAQTPHRE